MNEQTEDLFLRGMDLFDKMILLKKASTRRRRAIQLCLCPVTIPLGLSCAAIAILLVAPIIGITAAFWLISDFLNDD